MSRDTPTSVSTVRVRYAETDQMRVVYHANYLVWFEVARTDLLRSLGWSYREMEAAGGSLPVIEVHAEYRRPARYDDELEIAAQGCLLSPVRMEFQYTVRLRACKETTGAILGAEAPDPARREEGEYRVYSTDEQRRGAGRLDSQNPSVVSLQALSTDQTVVATGYSRHAAVGPSGRPCRLPARIRDVFA